MPREHQDDSEGIDPAAPSEDTSRDRLASWQVAAYHIDPAVLDQPLRPTRRQSRTSLADQPGAIPRPDIRPRFYETPVPGSLACDPPPDDSQDQDGPEPIIYSRVDGNAVQFTPGNLFDQDSPVLPVPVDDCNCAACREARSRPVQEAIPPAHPPVAEAPRTVAQTDIDALVTALNTYQTALRSNTVELVRGAGTRNLPWPNEPTPELIALLDQVLLQRILQQTHLCRSDRWNTLPDLETEDTLYAGKSPKIATLQRDLLAGRFADIAASDSIAEALERFYPGEHFATQTGQNALRTALSHRKGGALRLPRSYFSGTGGYRRIMAISLGDGYFTRWLWNHQVWTNSVQLPPSHLAPNPIPQRKSIQAFFARLPEVSKNYLRERIL